MRILITGGFGFVGGRVAVHLAKQGHDIVLGSRKATYSPAWMQKARVAHINWNDQNSLDLICRGVDVLIHAAGMSAQECMADPVAALTFNGLATARLVAAASRARVNQMIYLSTAHVYASPLEGIITENSCPKNLHPYATSHLAGEHAVLSACERGEIRGVVLRLSNAFGEPVQKNVNCWSLLVNDLCRQAVETNRFKLRTSGIQQRDFVPMNKICQVIEQLVQNNGQTTHTGIINVGSGLSRTIFEMAKLIQQRCHQAFGGNFEIERRNSIECENIKNLSYQSVKLVDIGRNFEQEQEIKEIDRLIEFCQENFN